MQISQNLAEINPCNLHNQRDEKLIILPSSMPSQSRTQKTILNAKVNAICWVVSILIAFFSRKILLQHLGDEFMGLASMLNCILGFLSIAELGVSAVIGVVLYKPLFDDDASEIKKIVSVLGYLYRYVGLAILALGVLLSLFLSIIISETTIPLSAIYVGFYAGLFSSLLGYFVNYRSVLLSADQKNYEVAGYYQLCNALKSIIQMILAVYVKSFIFFFLIEILFGIIFAYILNVRINKIYPWLTTDIKQGSQLLKQYPEIVTKVKQVFVHKIGGFVQNQSLPLFLYSFVSLPMVALYANYTMVVNAISLFASSILNTTSASVGNLIAEGNRETIYDVYTELFTGRFFFAALFSVCTSFAISDFISLWLSDEYVLSWFVPIIISLQIFLSLVRKVTDEFIEAYSLFHDVWSPVIECILFVLFATILGHYFGLEGVICAPVLSMLLVIYIWKPTFLFKQGLKRPITQYIILFFKNILAVIIAIAITFLIINHLSDILLLSSRSWAGWIITSIVFFVIASLCMAIIFYAISNEFRRFVARLSLILKAQK